METHSVDDGGSAETAGTASDHNRPPTSLPGPTGLPGVGNTVSFLRDPLGFLLSMRSYGDLAEYEAFRRKFALVSNPSLVEVVLVARNERFWRGEFESAFGDDIGIEGVFFAEGERWRRQRQLLQNAFTPDLIETYGSEMAAETERLVGGWTDGEVIDLRESLSELTLRVLTRTLFDLEWESERAGRVRRWVNALGSYIETELFGIRALLPARIPSRTKREFERATADVRALVDELVRTRRREGPEGDDLLSLLAFEEYPDGTTPSSETIGDQLLLFLLAGHETTATALTYACWLLAGDGGTRTRLNRELETVLGNAAPTVTDLEKLRVTEAICRESMRLYPPFPFLDREPREPTSLGGYRLEPGTTVQLNVYGIHRDERWWDTPHAFRPERWLDTDGAIDTGSDRPKYAYFPFGGGPRHCIGMRFAMTELQLSLATIAHRVDLERVTESIDPTPRVSLDPGAVEMRVRVR